ncbi:YceI family protein [Flavihumibacter sediminis]|nr:YceI family protein [Flavihumibacter sediminis]
MSNLLFILFHLFFTPESKPVAERWIIDKNSVFTIEGKSNVAPFKCQTVQYLNRDTITIFRDNNPNTAFTFGGGLKVMIRWFDCEQQVMTKEMWRTLREKEKPEMKINLIQVGRFKKSGEKVLGVVEVELAGVTKRFEIMFEVGNPSPHSLSFSGIRKLSFSDFRLKPPNKLAGLIKVEEDIMVKFKISLRAAGQ